MAELPWAVLAEFDSPERLVEAARAMRARGYRRLDAFTPWPVDDLPAALGLQERKVPVAMLAGGVLGAVGGMAMQVATNLDFPLWIGGRPLLALPAFVLIAFELMVLGAVAAGVLAFLVASRLPRLSHPMFDAERFDLSKPDRFFLAVLPAPRSDRAAIGNALAALKPEAILDIGGAAW